ncbi:hypothetical protein I6B53_06225 [Schaalia sp. 19OD2882]|uniref:hypothetical protein n=1 Tax=Schaalia sp. 19OD2882 TaxID=2794089 RepID=UPI001C1EB7ED|nr:hypothetical protein [Schaalia sp. 19OD2882]QWW18763.1 hypothetical protein I6B53_06225 [Schaalia sp. 19OD2882]
MSAPVPGASTSNGVVAPPDVEAALMGIEDLDVEAQLRILAHLEENLRACLVTPEN